MVINTKKPPGELLIKIDIDIAKDMQSSCYSYVNSPEGKVSLLYLKYKIRCQLITKKEHSNSPQSRKFERKNRNNKTLLLYVN